MVLRPPIPLCRAGLLSALIGLTASIFQAAAMGGKPEENKDPFVTVSAFAKAHGFKKPVYTENAVTLSNRWNHISLNVDSRKAFLNGVQVMLNTGVIKAGEDWKIDKTDVKKTLNPLLQPLEHLGGRNSTVIMLDPGHGGTDTGCHGVLSQHEKEIAVDVARQVFLDLVLQGYQVLMTRTGDTTLTLENRTKQAADLGADVFVSIHLNSSPGPEARGPETYVLALPGYYSTNATPEGEADGRVNSGNNFDDANLILGHAIHSKMVGLAKTDRGLRRARFQVLRDAPCPAVLVECGYLSNPEEEKKLVTTEYKEKMASAISRGIQEYCGNVRRGNLVAAPVKPATQTATKKAPTPLTARKSQLPVMPSVLHPPHAQSAAATPPAFHPPADALVLPPSLSRAPLTKQDVSPLAELLPLPPKKLKP